MLLQVNLLLLILLYAEVLAMLLHFHWNSWFLLEKLLLLKHFVYFLQNLINQSVTEYKYSFIYTLALKF